MEYYIGKKWNDNSPIIRNNKIKHEQKYINIFRANV